ncbi:hypothetical protein LUZ63_013345 [Rhynchospora breviuscula]|uniref:Calmodulin-binding protein 60 A-like n=1 Tax=Rhynchospora breviuscula TaxID=2022672 RepID=A0A9Q0HKU1_9POAL|nr:hypothetical protein LUZ63_013345 [Rhynchospora breviuscula]
MAPKRKLGPSSEEAWPSRPAKSRGLTSSSQENGRDSFKLEMQRMISTLNCKIEELQAKADGFDELRAKVNELERELHILKRSTVLENPIDENQTTREPANLGRCELKIMNDIKERVYTGSEVQGQDGELLKVAICDNGQKITSGSLASARFEVVVLEGNLSLAKAWPEVGSVLAHAYVYQFSNGEAVLEGLKFKDNSNRAVWRLGIKVLKNFNVRVQEAISDPFRVLDRHGKASEKPDVPLLEHGVERLKKVGQKRAVDLKEKNGIITIKDFLQLYHKNPKKLRKILKIMSESDESWKSMFAHAKKCDTGSNLYSYQKKNTVLFFNCVYEVVGAAFGNRYIPFDKLKDSKKILINKRKKSFYKKFKIESLVADFEFQNGQPVPIEHHSTGNSTKNDAPQCDQDAVLQNMQPADATQFSDNSAPDIRRDAYQDIMSDHNTTQHYHSISDEITNQVQGHEGSIITPNSTPELNSTLVNENSAESVEESCDDVNSWREILHVSQDRPIFSVHSSPFLEDNFSDADFSEWLAVLDDIPSVRRNLSPRGIWLFMRLALLHFRRNPGPN